MEKPAYWGINQIMLYGKLRKRLMLVLKTFPCRRIKENKRCFICGFDQHSRGVKRYNIVSQFDYLKDIIYSNRIEHIDFLGSGSLLDEEQVRQSQLFGLIENVRRNKFIKSFLIEGRTEYCDFNKLKKIKQLSGRICLEYGFGLECYSDYVRNVILRKDLKLHDYIECVKRLAKINVGVCTYILAGIPKLDLEDSLKETRDSMLAVSKIYKKYDCRGRIAIYPVFIAPNSGLEELYKNGAYELIKLEHVIKIMLGVKDKIDFKKIPVFIGLDDEKISQQRFVGFGDGKLSGLIKKFNSTQDISLFEGVA